MNRSELTRKKLKPVKGNINRHFVNNQLAIPTPKPTNKKGKKLHDFNLDKVNPFISKLL